MWTIGFNLEDAIEEMESHLLHLRALGFSFSMMLSLSDLMLKFSVWFSIAFVLPAILSHHRSYNHRQNGLPDHFYVSLSGTDKGV